MREDRIPFLVWTYPLDVLLERQAVIDYLLMYIRDGVADDYSPAVTPESFDQFKNAVTTRVYHKTRDAIQKIPPKLRDNQDCGKTFELVADAINSYMDFGTKKLPFAAIHLGSDALTKQLNGALDVISRPKFPNASTMEEAFEIAMFNMALVRSRLACIHALTVLLEFDRFPESKMDVSSLLWTKQVRFQRDALLLGSLLGGTYQARSADTVCRQTMYNPDASVGYSLIHYLEVGGRNPGSYLSNRVDTFKTEVEKSFKKLSKKL